MNVCLQTALYTRVFGDDPEADLDEGVLPKYDRTRPIQVTLHERSSPNGTSSGPALAVPSGNLSDSSTGEKVQDHIPVAKPRKKKLKKEKQFPVPESKDSGPKPPVRASKRRPSTSSSSSQASSSSSATYDD